MEKEKNVNSHEIRLEMQDKREGNSSYFELDHAKISAIFTTYQQRKHAEELDDLKRLGADAGVASKLKTSLDLGITQTSADALAHRVAEFGENRFEEEEIKHCCVHVWEALGDLFLQILIGAALVQIVLGATVSDEPSKDWIDGFSIIIAVVIVVSVGSITNYQKDKKFKSLSDTNKDTIKFVLHRNGKSEVNPETLLVGDIVELDVGHIIPADGMLIAGSIKADESSLTGESLALEKFNLETCLKKKGELREGENQEHLPSPLIYSGTNVVEGQGKFLVLRVGKFTFSGSIREQVMQNQEAEDSKTPLEEKLEAIAGQIGYFGMISAAVTLVALFIQFGVNYSNSSTNFNVSTQKNTLLNTFGNNFNNTTLVNMSLNNMTNPSSQVSGSILNIFLLCVAIIVVAIPEGLPLAVTLALAFSISKMMKEKNLVRKIKACETMGGANFICTDKTGTLTKNIMSVSAIYNGSQDVILDKVTETKTQKSPEVNFPNKTYYDIFKMAVMLNLDVKFDEKEEIIKANKSDQGLIDLFQIYGENICRYRNQYLGDSPKVIPFSSDRKRMSAFAKSKDFPTGYRLFLKGASDILLSMSGYYIDPNTNQKSPLTSEDSSRFKEKIKEFASLTYRTLAICYKDISAADYEEHTQCDESGLTLVAIVGILDNLRPGVEDAVVTCKGAGITTIMVTGDLLETAFAIAKNCSIVDKGLVLPDPEKDPEKYRDFCVAMEGREFFKKIGGLICMTCKLSGDECRCPRTKAQAEKMGKKEKDIKKDKIRYMDEFTRITKEIRVIARCRPIDKYALVLGLRALNNVVAVTGDGTNDAPALSKSDVGFAMGIQGTDIAKQASDIIIMDDNFASIVTAVKWGRSIFDNIRKFIQFQLSINVCACLLVFITACIGNETPLKPIQMLWVNLIMDSLGSLALATEPPHEKLLKRKPYARNEKIINPLMWKHILLQALFSLGIQLFLYLNGANFIVEDDPTRIIEYQKLINCYGIENFPGKAPVTNADGSLTYYIIQGSSAFWSSEVSVRPGCLDYSQYANQALAYKGYISKFGGTSHLTIVFNCFVLYALFNQINVRVIDDSINILYRIHSNLYFIVVTIIEFGLQAILIQFFSSFFKVASGGLTASQWGICIGFGAITFPVNFILKFIPVQNLIEKVIGSTNAEEKEEEQEQNPNDVSYNKDHKENKSLTDRQKGLDKDADKGGIIQRIGSMISNRGSGKIKKTDAEKRMRQGK